MCYPALVGGLLALAPALSGLVGPPGATVLVLLRHLDVMLAAPEARTYRIVPIRVYCVMLDV